MSLVDLSIRRPVTIFIFAVAAVVFGWVAFGNLATDLLPDITYPSLTVRTDLPGAAPVEVENLVTRPIEDAVGVVSNLVRVSSSSRAEVSEVVLEFAWGTSMDFAALDVRERLDVIRLPQDAEPPVLLRYDPSLDPILRIAVTGDSDLTRLRRLTEERIQRPLERLEGVAAVVAQGGLEEEMQVDLDERRLANLGLTAELVANRLAQENINITGGRLVDGQSRFMVRTVNEILRPDQIRDLVVARLPSVDGTGRAVVRVSDVATVRQGFQEREIITRVDGEEAVELAIYKAGGTNTVSVSSRVRERVDELRESLLKVNPDLRITQITDQARYIEASVREVLETAAMGGALAILVLFLFLRSWKTTSIIGIAIPISVVATFFLMYAFNISLNIMSLGGLTLGIGLLVDNAIVVLESIQRKRDEGLGVVEAARTGAKEVSSAIAASTFTSICVFLPIVFVEGVAAQFFTDQALTVTFSLLVSLIVALTVIPMLASRQVPEEDPIDGEQQDGWVLRAAVAVTRVAKTGLGLVLKPVVWLLDRPAALFQWAFERLEEGYAGFLAGALKRPFLVLLIGGLLLAAGLAFIDDLGGELVPELVQGEFFADLELPPGTHLDVTQRRMAVLEQEASRLDHIERIYAIAGSSSQQGGIAGESREHRGQLTFTVSPPFSREKEEALMTEVRELVERDEDLEARFGRPSYFSFKTPIEIELRGFNLKLLRRLSDDLTHRLASTPGFTDVESSAEGGLPELQINFDRQRLSAYDLTIQQVASVIRTKIQGDVATEIQRQDRTIDIRVRSQETYRSSIEDLKNLIVYQQDKLALPLSAVAEVVEAEGPAEIRRVDGERAALITANLDGLDLASAAAEIEAAVADLNLPAGFDWRLGGQQKEMETSFASMRLAISLAIFLVYLVMASQFESLLHPFVILFSVPLSLIGVIATMVLFDVRISVVVLIGVVLLAGIVVNNAIILVDTANRLRRDGVERLAAISQAGRLRLRPILMTTATTVLGLLPMAIGLGEGSELRAPMALVVIGGLLASTLLTLVVVPAAYRILER